MMIVIQTAPSRAFAEKLPVADLAGSDGKLSKLSGERRG